MEESLPNTPSRQHAQSRRIESSSSASLPYSPTTKPRNKPESPSVEKSISQVAMFSSSEPGKSPLLDVASRLKQYLSPGHQRLRQTARSMLMRPAMRTMIKITVEGEENVDGLEGAFIVVANHSSHLDAPIMFSCLPEHISKRLATGAAADYFYKKKYISRLTSLFFNTFPVDRTPRNSRTGGHQPGMSVSLLRAGIPILIFPEGTRSRDGKIGKFKPGTAAIAIKIRCPIVPVAMIGNREAMPVGAKLPKPGRHKIRVLIGKPMRAFRGENVEDFSKRVETRVRVMYEIGDPHATDLHTT